MAKGMSMKVLLQLQTREFQKGIKSVQKQLRGFQNFVKSAFALGSVTMLGKKMVEVGASFEDAMAKVQAVSNATADEFKKMQREAEKLGKTTRYTATEAAQALENLTRNGMSAADATKSLAGVLQLAQANSIQLADAANIVTNTLNMFKLGVEQTNRVNDVLSSTASHAATNITELYEAMTNAAPIANVLGFSIEEVSSALGALAQQGLKGAAAGTNLRIVMMKLADSKVIAKLHEQGIEIDENTMKTEGLKKTIEKLAKANLSLTDLGKIFSSKAAPAVQQLIGGLEDLDTLLQVTSTSAGETERMFNQSVGSVRGELDALKSAYEGLLISISQKTSGVVKGVIKLLQNLIRNFESVTGTLLNIASVVVPLLIRNVVKLGTSFKAMCAQVVAGATAAKAAIGGWVGIIITLVTWVGTYFYGAWDKATRAVRDANKQIDQATIAIEKNKKEVKSLQEKIGDGSDKASLNYAVKRATELFPEFANAINDAAKIAAKTQSWEALKSLLQDIADLQDTILTKEAYEAMYAAQIDRLGQEMWNASSQYWYNPGDWGRWNREKGGADIKSQLKEKYLTDEGVKEVYKEMAKVYVSAIKTSFEKLPSMYQVEGGNEVYARDSLKKFLDKLGVVVDEHDFNRWISNFDTKYASLFNNQKSFEHTQQTIETGKKVDQLDSIQTAQTAAVAKQEFENQMKLIVKNDREANEKRYKYAEEYLTKLYQLGEDVSKEQLEEAEKIFDQYKAYAPSTGGGGSYDESGGKKGEKSPSDKIKDLIDDYNEEITKLENRKKEGTIADKEYYEELAKVEDKTWEAITAISNFEDVLNELGQGEFGQMLKGQYAANRAYDKQVEANQAAYDADTKLSEYRNPKREKLQTRGKTAEQIKEERVRIEFDYADSLEEMIEKLQKEIENGDYEPIKGDAIKVLENLKEKAKEAKDEAEGLQAKLDLAQVITKLDDAIKDLNSSFLSTFEGFADAMDRVMSSLMSIAQIFDEDLRDSPMYQAFEAFTSTLSSSIQLMQATMSMIELVTKLQNKAALSKLKNSAVEIAANEAVTASEAEQAKTAAGAAITKSAESVANIPYVGPALAIAAAISVAAALAAAMSKFEKGGIVGGNSFAGDNQVIRANSGEMVITRGQQASLWKAIQTGNLGGGNGNVKFIIRGEDLVGVFQNYNRLRG